MIRNVSTEPRERMTIRQQWRSYAELPPMIRRSRRAGMVAGALVLLGLILLAGRIAGWALLALWRATSWA
jgi:hypothetical protein